VTTRNARIRFCANNLAAGSGATCTASSANASYPLSNVLDNRRWKTWRTNGNFTITAGTNDKIYVNDTANVTATLTAGNYSGGAALAAHIQTQLNAVSTNWTCTYSSTTYRFTIGRSSGTATLRMTVTTAAAWSTIGYSRATDLAVGTGTAAETMALHTSESVVVDLGAGQPTEFFSIVGQLGYRVPDLERRDGAALCQ
jgi:acetylornithine deacetylase/succinyl-diaminopimelate desuccinylase-like protein